MFPPQTPAAPTAAPNDALIFDADISNFESAVMEASMATPILVDFWAPWCGPCRQLGPVLEDAVTAAAGAIKLAKVNLDENQQLAAALQVRSVPTVFAIFQGRPVDAFTGALPPTQIKAFIDKIIAAAGTGGQTAEGPDLNALMDAALEAQKTGDLATAHGLYAEILSHDQHNAPALAGLVRVLLDAGQTEQARQIMENAPEDLTKDPVFTAVKTALELTATTSVDEGEILSLAGRVEKDANDHEARFALASALFAHNRKEEAIDALLEIIRRDRSWEEDKARKELLKFFEALGPTDPLTVAGRKKLSSVLFS